MGRSFFAKVTPVFTSELAYFPPHLAKMLRPATVVKVAGSANLEKLREAVRCMAKQGHGRENVPLAERDIRELRRRPGPHGQYLSSLAAGRNAC